MLLTSGKHTEEKTDTYLIHFEEFFVHFDISTLNIWFLSHEKEIITTTVRKLAHVYLFVLGLGAVGYGAHSLPFA